MSVAHAVMGVLARGERYGYDLRRTLESELGADWRVDFGQLYRVLATMSSKGWVAYRLESGDKGPARKVYSLTRKGRAELEQWLRGGRATLGPRRDAGVVRRHLGARLADSAEPHVLAVGNDDPILAALARRLALEQQPVRFAPQPMCSLPALIAMHERRAQIAGIHLLDVDSGEYNAPYVKHLLPEEAMVLIQLARREQGLMLAPGNPKGIRGVRDLARRGVRLANRQRGAGTRLLLHHLLNRARVDSSRIRGYHSELPTHAAVAAQVAAGTADVGPGVRAAAAAHGLDFVPLGEERYDLAIPRRLFESRGLRPLLEILHDRGFQREAALFPGYDVSRMSRVVKVG